MLRKINGLLNIVIGSFVGVFIGFSIYKLWDYKAHPDLYAMQSAPWYTGILVHGIFTVVVLVMAVLVKLIIRDKLRKR